MMDFRNILNTIDHLSEGIFDDDEIAAKNVQAQADLEKWKSDRKALQTAEINKIKKLINQYSKLKGINYTVNESISKELIESFGYDYVLQEYNTSDFKSDVADFGRGVASGASLGYAPEIAAKIRSSTGNISYEDALKQELAKNAAAKKRSPWLYNTGSVAPAMAIGGPLGWGATAADIMYGKDDFANPFSDDNDSKKNPDVQPAPTTDLEKTAKTEPSLADTVSDLQTKLVNAGFNVGPSGIDGKFGVKTISALKQYTEVNKLPSDLDAYLKLISNSANTDSKEKVSEAEQIAVLRKTLNELEEGIFGTAMNVGKNLIKGIGKGAAKTAILGGKSAVFGAKLAAKIGGKLAKFANNHKVATILTGLALYGYTFNPDGDIVALNDIENTLQDITPTSDVATTSDNIPTSDITPEKPTPPLTPSPITTNTEELSQLASQIDWLIKYASTDTSPELTTELDNIKRQWANLSK